jgi:hypothetical protein
MPYPRALDDEEATAVEQWYRDYERVGSVNDKARELGVSRQALYDAIRRVRGLDTTATRRKLTAFGLGSLVGQVVTIHVEHRQEPRQTVGEQLDDSEKS